MSNFTDRENITEKFIRDKYIIPENPVKGADTLVSHITDLTDLLLSHPEDSAKHSKHANAINEGRWNAHALDDAEKALIAVAGALTLLEKMNYDLGKDEKGEKISYESVYRRIKDSRQKILKTRGEMHAYERIQSERVQVQ